MGSERSGVIVGVVLGVMELSAAAGCSGAAAPAASPVAAPEARVDPPRPAEGNPFDGADIPVDPSYVAELEGTIPVAARSGGRRAAQLRALEAFPTAVWFDSIASTATASRYLDDALALQKRTGKPVVSVFVAYDLPERDCSAQASSGELSALQGGEARYKAEFLDPLASQFRSHPAQRIVVVLEPDSLGNIVTNTRVPKCADAVPVYERSIATAIRTLSMPNVWLYLDVAHAGWLGWNRNRSKLAALVKDVLVAAGGTDRIRGFATNVSNYDPLHDGDLPRLEPSDPCPDELTYVDKLSATLADAGITGKGFLIDTGRNGRGARSKSGSWCNVAGAGLGERPRSSPAPGVDAYMWIKPPGGSDGGSDPSAPGFDPSCGHDSADSMQGAPPAGHWFPAHLFGLIDHASPPL
jgi:cellulose 1,4-beta-cellobiosidase